MIYWPHEPPDDAVVLVRAEGQSFIDGVRKGLDSLSIPYTMGGTRRDDVTFFVPEDRRAEAEAGVRNGI